MDQEDYNTPPYLLSQLKSFTTNPPSSDAAEPPFVPLEGSRIRTLVDDHLTSYDASEMLGIEIADSSSEDENDPLQGIEHLTRYWKPRNGDIGILSTTTALTIASLTGCSLYPETHEKRVRLVNGDFEAALNKLRNLEPLMVSYLKHLVPVLTVAGTSISSADLQYTQSERKHPCEF